MWSFYKITFLFLPVWSNRQTIIFHFNGILQKQILFYAFITVCPWFVDVIYSEIQSVQVQKSATFWWAWVLIWLAGLWNAAEGLVFMKNILTERLFLFYSSKGQILSSHDRCNHHKMHEVWSELTTGKNLKANAWISHRRSYCNVYCAISADMASPIYHTGETTNFMLCTACPVHMFILKKDTSTLLWHLFLRHREKGND